MELAKRLIVGAFFALLVMSVYNKGYESGYNKKQVEVIKLEQEYAKKLSETNLEAQRRLDEVSRGYQQELQDLQVSTSATIDKLSADNKRLYVRIKSTSDSKCTHRPEPSYRAELDEGTTRKLIEITKRGDAWIRALQDTIKQKEKHDARNSTFR